MTHALICLNHATYGGVYYCSDFTTSGTQPTWTKLTTTGLANLECTHFRVDYDDPLNKQYVRLSNEYIYYRNGGNWSKVLDHTIAAAAAGESATNAVLRHLWTDPTTPGAVYALFMTDPAPIQNGKAYVLKSLDYGANWTAYQFATGRASIGQVEAVGNSIWASAGKLVIATSVFNYSNDGGATWKGLTTNAAGSSTTASVRINPISPNECWLFGDGSNNYWTWLAGYTSRIPVKDPSVSGRNDALWFDPNTSGRAIISNPNNAVYWSSDNFVSSNTVTQVTGAIAADRKIAVTGPDNNPSSLELVYSGRSDTSVHMAGYLASHLDTSAEDRAGTNTATPPYTDAIPRVVESSIYGVWWGSPPADKGVFLFSVEEGDITNIPDADNLGLPLFGDRSSWRDYDADDDGDGTELSRYHAQDIRDDMPQRHNPWPAAVGTAPVSDGSKYIATDIITQAEFDYSFYLPGYGHCPVTLDADAALVLDLQGGCLPAQEIGLDVQQPTYVWMGPSFAPPDEPTFQPIYLEQLANVQTTAPIGDGELLTFDGAIGQWVNATRHNRVVTTLTAGSYTLDDTYDVVVLDATGGNIMITLPQTSTNDGLEYAFKRIDDSANTVSINAYSGSFTLLDSDSEILTDSDDEILEDSDGGGIGGGDTIDGDDVQYLDSQYLAIQIVADADNSAWWII